MKKMLLITGVVFAIIFGWYGIKSLFIKIMMAHYTLPPAVISSTTAQLETWNPKLNSIGSLSAINGVDVTTEISGMVSSIRFNSGQMVKQGDVIVLLDTSVELADLKSSQAKLKLATINYNRDQILFGKNATSQSVIDTDMAQLQEAEANVESIQAKIQQKTITAPFAGYLGIRQVNLGQYIQAGTSIVTLQALNPLYVEFNLPEENLSDLYINQPIDITVNSQNENPIRGMITAINSKVDPATRNIKVQATIPNGNLTLRPGMFVNVTVWLRQIEKVIVLPETAISYSLHGDAVYVIEPDKSNKKILRANRHYVKVGERRGDVVTILEGVNSGEQIVASGQLKLQDGASVAVNNELH